MDNSKMMLEVLKAQREVSLLNLEIAKLEASSKKADGEDLNLPI